MSVRAGASGGGAGSGGGFVQFGGVKLTSADVTTTSATFVDLTGATVTMTTGAHRCLINFMAVGLNSAGNQVAYDLLIDGVSQSGTSLGMVFLSSIQANTANVNFNFTFMTGVLTAASHTFKMQWLTSGGTATTRASAGTAPLILQVMETGLTT